MHGTGGNSGKQSKAWPGSWEMDVEVQYIWLNSSCATFPKGHPRHNRAQCVWDSIRASAPQFTGKHCTEEDTCKASPSPCCEHCCGLLIGRPGPYTNNAQAFGQKVTNWPSLGSVLPLPKVNLKTTIYCSSFVISL